MKNLSEMNEHRYPHYVADCTAERLAKQLCDADCRQKGFNPSFNEEISIRHHKMTIALAMPDKVKK